MTACINKEQTFGGTPEAQNTEAQSTEADAAASSEIDTDESESVTEPGRTELGDTTQTETDEPESEDTGTSSDPADGETSTGDEDPCGNDAECADASTTESEDPSETEPDTDVAPSDDDTSEPEATEPEATEPEATEPEATEPEATEPEATEPEATEPEATEDPVPTCADDNGGCDALAECTDTQAGPSCGACPSGYAGDGTTGCAPTLLGLSVSRGVLSPELDLWLDTYDVVIPVFARDLILTPSVPQGSSVTIQGASIAQGAAWTSPSLSLGLNTISIHVQQAGQPSTAYTLRVTRGASATVYVKASNSGVDDLFGHAVALSEDGTTLAVGVPREDGAGKGVNPSDNNSAGQAGAVYVFVRSGSSWSQQAYIKASNAEANDSFGFSLALTRDGNLLAVGAEGEASESSNETLNDAPGAGAVYVFARSGNSWWQQDFLRASDAGPNRWFGAGVALSGGNGTTLAVGAPQTAAVYVFVRSGGAWSEQQRISGQAAYFGEKLALSGDGNTLAAGAYGDSTGATGVDGDVSGPGALFSGSVQVFVRSNNSWSRQAYIKASNAAESDSFGRSVALSADGNTLAAGANGESSDAVNVDGDQSNDNRPNSGAVYVLERSGNTWAHRTFVKASNPGEDDWYGHSVALSGDGSTLAVGATYESGSAQTSGGSDNNSANGAGAVYVYR